MKKLKKLFFACDLKQQKEIWLFQLLYTSKSTAAFSLLKEVDHKHYFLPIALLCSSQLIKISALPVTPLQYFRQNVHYCCMGGCCFMCLSFTWWISYGPPAFLNATNFEEYTILHYTRYLISAKIKPAWTPQQTSFVKSAFLPKERRGVAISRNLSKSWKIEKIHL